MTISRCEWPFTKGIRGLRPSEARKLASEQPSVCPHTDCTAPKSCAERCAAVVENQAKRRASAKAGA